METPHTASRTTLTASAAARRYFDCGLKPVVVYSLNLDKTACACSKSDSCDSPGKHPKLKNWKKIAADTSPQSLTKNFPDRTKNNIGLLTGLEGGIICIDIDPKHNGFESLQQLFAAHSIESFPPTWEANSGSGGKHYVFRHPGEAFTVSNIQDQSKLGSGVDVRGEGGQFVAYPSDHISGNIYEWVNAPWDETPLADLPDWLAAIIVAPTSPAGPPPTTPAAAEGPEGAQRVAAWANAALNSECEAVRCAPAGNANNRINQAAFAMGGIVAAGHLAEDVVFAALLEAARARGKPEEESTKTIRSGLESGKKEPRHPPERPLVPTRGKKTEPARNGEASDFSLELADDPHRLARLFIEKYGMHGEYRKLYYWQQNWHTYSPAGHCYRAVPDFEIAPRIAGLVKAEFDAIAQDNAKKAKPVTRGIVSNALLALQDECLLPSSAVPAQPAWVGGVGSGPVLAVQNGLLDLNKLQSAASETEFVLPHDPRWFSPVCLPVEFKLGATCDQWIQFLEQVFEGDQERIALLQEFFGYCLTPETDLEAFAMFTGEGANGKSVVCEVLRALLGDSNVSAVSLEMFGERFQLIATLGKLANISTEIGELDKAAEGFLKQYTSGEKMGFEAKRKQVFFAKPTAKLVFSTNNLPRFADKSGGLWRRLLLFPFEVVIPAAERNSNMRRAEYWAAEMPGILNWALVGLARIQVNGRFTESQRVTEAVDEYRRSENPTWTFFEEHLVLDDPEAKIHTEAIYAVYKTWCSKNGFYPFNLTKFGIELARWGKANGRIFERIRFRVGGGLTKHGFVGISIASEV